MLKTMNLTMRVRQSLAVLALCLVAGTNHSISGAASERAQASASSWLSAAAEAMGGEARLRAISAVETSGVSVWYSREQSERPEGPWMTSFTDFTDVRHAGVVQRTSRVRGFAAPDWVDNEKWTSPSTILVTDGGAFSRADGTLSPAPTPPDLEVLPVGLAPERLVLAARDAADLRAEADETLD